MFCPEGMNWAKICNMGFFLGGGEGVGVRRWGVGGGGGTREKGQPLGQNQLSLNAHRGSFNKVLLYCALSIQRDKVNDCEVIMSILGRFRFKLRDLRREILH